MSEDGGEDDRADIRAWLQEEALNLDKIFSGEPRLDFMAWKAQRDAKARIVRGGKA